jgi:hypothetical protein
MELQPLTLRLKARSGSRACVQPPKNFCPHMARKVVRMPLPRLGRVLEDVRIKNAAVAPTIVVDRRSERSPSQLGYCS